MIANLRTFGRIICTTFATVRPYNASHSEYCVIWNSLQFCTTMNEFNMIQTYSICIEIQHSMYVTQRCRPNQYWEWLQYWNHVRTYLNQAKLSHWLDVAEQVRYKLSVLMYWCQYNQASLSDRPLHASFSQFSASAFIRPAVIKSLHATSWSRSRVFCSIWRHFIFAVCLFIRLIKLQTILSRRCKIWSEKLKIAKLTTCKVK